jgi:hypothetical protein
VTEDERALIIDALARAAARLESYGRARPHLAGPHDRKAAAMRALRARLMGTPMGMIVYRLERGPFSGLVTRTDKGPWMGWYMASWSAGVEGGGTSAPAGQDAAVAWLHAAYQDWLAAHQRL